MAKLFVSHWVLMFLAEKGAERICGGAAEIILRSSRIGKSGPTEKGWERELSKKFHWFVLRRNLTDAFCESPVL